MSKNSYKTKLPPVQFKRILDGIEKGISLSKLCTTEKISTKTFWADIVGSSERGNEYAQAKENAIESELEAIHALEDEMVAAIRASDPKQSNAIATAYRCKIDNLKWIASKLKPKKYGERLNVDADTSLRVTIVDGKGKAIDI